MKAFRSISLVVLFLAVLSQGAYAAATDSPVGRWQTIDDATNKPQSIVRIYEQNGKLFGRVEKFLNPDPKNPNPLCQDCSGALKNKPVLGLRMLWDMQKDKDGWSGGTILDPETGKSYKCLMTLQDGGAKLKVRGFIGFALIGRTQIWNRQ